MSTAESGLLLPDFPIMDRVTIDNVRPGGLYDCTVPLDLIQNYKAPIDFENIEKLKRQIEEERARRGGTGQTKPAHFGYVAHEDFFRIIDGFHRNDIFKVLSEPAMFATIELLPLEELLDQRIINANMHDDIKLSRTAEWLGEVWALHPLSEKIKVSSVFILAQFKDYKGTTFNLTETDVEDCREWAKAKAEKWKTSVGSIYSNLKIAKHIAPEFVPNVRPASAKKDPTKEDISISQPIAKAFSDKLADKLGHQRLLATQIDPKNLSTTEVTKLATEIADMSLAQARIHINNIDWDRKRAEKTQTFKYTEDDFFRTGLIRGTSVIQPLLEVAQYTVISVLDTDINDLPKSTLQKLSTDLETTAAAIERARTAVESALEGTPVDTNLESYNIDTLPTRSLTIEEFSQDFATGLNTGNFPKITSENQYRLVRDTLDDPELLKTLDAEVVTKLKQHVKKYNSIVK